MNKKRIRNFLIMLLVLIECTSIVLSVKSFKNREISEIKEENKIENDKFGMYLETVGTDGEITYEEYKSSGIFPTGYKINLNKSKCEDINGQEVEDAISGRKTKITITSDKTLFCYVYFDIDYTLSQLCTNGEELGSCMIDHNDDIDSLGDTAYAEMYRYTGTNEIVEDNYICFGTDNKNTCLNNQDKYMYRVIGITSEVNSTLGLDIGQLKLIKKDSIGKQQWYTDYVTDIKWENSLIYNNINTSGYLTNSTYMPSGWKNKIDSVKWNIGDVNFPIETTTINGPTVKEKENDNITTSLSKIGLIYLSDFYYSYIEGGNQNCNPDRCGSWLYNNDHMYTMTRYGRQQTGWYYTAWNVDAYSYYSGDGFTYLSNIRPSFYLNKEEIYVSGNGTIDDPIMLVDQEAPENNSITINSGAEYTVNNVVTLTLNSEGATKMCISESTSCTNWENYATSKNYTLPTTLGAKTIYVYYKDDAGNISQVASDTINLYESITVPSQSGTLTYSGSTQSPSWSNYDSSKMTISGTTSGTDAKLYAAKFTPKANYIWSDGTTTSKTVYWIIGKAPGSLSVPITSMTIKEGEQQTFEITRSGNGSISASSNNTGVATVSIIGTNITVNGVSAGTATITINVGAGTNHLAAESKTVSVTVTDPKVTIGEKLISLKPTGLNTSTVYGNMYRFIGPTANNYVKLDNQMFRIIGIVASNSSLELLETYQIKLISDSSVTTTDLYSASAYLSNNNGVPSSWINKIDNVRWYGGGVDDVYGYDGNTLYYQEIETSYDFEYAYDPCKVHFIRLSDLAYSRNSSGQTWLTHRSWTSVSVLCWYGDEWGDYTEVCNQWRIYDGYADWDSYQIYDSYPAHAVIYLNKDVYYKSGSGTSGDPFILE